MAARTRKGTKDTPWSDETRGRISASMLINRLEDHVLKDKPMTRSQITAANILLKKVIPDLAQHTVQLEESQQKIVTHVYAPMESDEAWIEAVSPPLKVVGHGDCGKTTIPWR